VVVVGLEAAVHAEAAVEREAGDERGRPVPRALEVLGGGADLARQDVAAVVAQPVAEWSAAGEDRRVRWPRQRHVGYGGLEAHAASGQTVERRS
jgi:hypothetical protein